MGFDRLIENIVRTQNPSVVGLDPKLDYIPAYIKEKKFEKYGKTLEGAAKAILSFNKKIIDEIYDIVPAIKPQAAYYEMYGWQGVKTLYKTIEGLWLDANSAQQRYAAALEKLRATETSYELVQEQFSLGMKNTVELLTEKSNLLSAQQEMLQAKYMSLLNAQLLRFYQGEALHI